MTADLTPAEPDLSGWCVTEDARLTHLCCGVCNDGVEIWIRSNDEDGLVPLSTILLWAADHECHPDHDTGGRWCQTMRQATDWNENYPVGTRVRYWPVLGQDDSRVAETTTPAWATPSGSALVSITGQTGGVKLDHLAVLNDDAPLDPEPQNPDLTSADQTVAEILVREHGRGERTFLRAEDFATEAREMVAAVRPLIAAEVRAEVHADLVHAAADLRANADPEIDLEDYISAIEDCASRVQRKAARVAEGGERRGG